ncbi:hypothetical protein AB0J80_00375 [Actinoplanes sp. NPDC049548]|uniref:hypothetical protein n=1 Tax=Actinoplanes sp. NPDC049548 TaxID=3155152 RepID=UPI0034216041
MAGPARRAVEMEIAMWRSLVRWLLRRPAPLSAGDVPFPYLGVVKPILGIFIALSIVEIPILDLVIRKVVPWQPARWIMLVISIWGLLWMLGLYAGMRINPHVVGAAGIQVRMGPTLGFTIAWADVESATRRHRTMPSAKSVQIEDDALHIVAGSQTSVDLRLRRPMTFHLPNGETPAVQDVRVYADDPDAFVRKAREVRASAGARKNRPAGG